MTEAQNKLYEKAKQYAKENVKGNCDELKCLAVMLYEFATEATKELQDQLTEKDKQIKELKKTISKQYDDYEEIMDKTIESCNGIVTDYQDIWDKEKGKLEAQIEELKASKTTQTHNLNVLNDEIIRLQNEGEANVKLSDEINLLKAQIEKMKYALNKIIKTVHNDLIDGYGERLVKIYDISCEVLQEIEK